MYAIPSKEMIARAVERWPGKSPVAPGGIAHPAIHHLLDVAAVGERLIAPWTLPEPHKSLCVLLVALHDLGKIGEPFRRMLQTGAPQSAGLHWEATEAYLRFFDVDLLEPCLYGDRDARWSLYAAAAGHHGRPPCRDLTIARKGARPVGDFKRLLDHAGDEALDDARAVVRLFLSIWSNASASDLSLAEAHRLSWRLAGLTTTADWIASNVAWFPPTAPGPGIEALLASARARAIHAVREAGLDTPPPRDTPLFDFDLRPMQSACAEVAITDGPFLAILEDETGSGKTEAALILAQRMLLAGKGRGLYFALPTMATADAMFARVVEVLRRLYEGGPSLALAHGRADHSDLFRELKDAHAHNPDDPGPRDWLADNRRRALLADVGVGTIDQALLAVVKAKHAALRQFGLSSKILIVDEVHEVGDPYMGELLATLLEVHAGQGGSAILLSATLPLALRAKLVAAFEKGAGREPGPRCDDPVYPALVASGGPAIPVRPAASKRGEVRVERLSGPAAALDLLIAKAEEGAACVWVRNAVDEAIAAVEALRARGVEADLLHARFALVDRKRHEKAALATYGKGRALRPGRILVSTQIVESSLDLDFDVMVSDLAPMAALIQRAGRLWRHMDLRPASARPEPEPVLRVVAPDPDVVTSERWLDEAIGRGAFVYPPALQWRTARVLFDAGVIDAPSDLRRLIEQAHDMSPLVPPALETADGRWLGEAKAQRNHAGQNLIDWAEGYRAGAKGAGDADFPTRLGKPQRTLLLARRESGRLLPWHGQCWSVENCQLSEVQTSAARLQDMSLPDQQSREVTDILALLPDWMSSTRTICEVEGTSICRGLIYRLDSGLMWMFPISAGITR